MSGLVAMNPGFLSELQGKISGGRKLKPGFQAGT